MELGLFLIATMIIMMKQVIITDMLLILILTVLHQLSIITTQLKGNGILKMKVAIKNWNLILKVGNFMILKLIGEFKNIPIPLYD
jgi:hypothetical protein